MSVWELLNRLTLVAWKCVKFEILATVNIVVLGFACNNGAGPILHVNSPEGFAVEKCRESTTVNYCATTQRKQTCNDHCTIELNRAIFCRGSNVHQPHQDANCFQWPGTQLVSVVFFRQPARCPEMRGEPSSNKYNTMVFVLCQQNLAQTPDFTTNMTHIYIYISYTPEITDILTAFSAETWHTCARCCVCSRCWGGSSGPQPGAQASPTSSRTGSAAPPCRRPRCPVT